MNRIIFFIALLFFASCASKPEKSSVKTVWLGDATERDVLASELFKSMDCVKLETSKGCMLAGLVKIDICGDKLYIIDGLGEQLFEFNLNGKCLRTLNKKGRGAGEYNRIDDFYIDTINGTVELLDRDLKNIYCYSLADFSYKETLRLPITFCFRFTKKGDYYYLKTNTARNIVEGQPTNSDIIAFNRKTGKVKPLFDKLLPDNENQSFELNNVFTNNSVDNLYASLAWGEYLYNIAGDKISPFLKVDAGNRAFPLDIIKGNYTKRMEYLESGRSKGKAYFFKLTLFEEDKFIISYSLEYPLKASYYISLNNGGKTLQAKSIKNDFTPFSMQDIEIYCYDEGYLVSGYYPGLLDDEVLLQQLGVGINDNPVIVLFKFK